MKFTLFGNGIIWGALQMVSKIHLLLGRVHNMDGFLARTQTLIHMGCFTLPVSQLSEQLSCYFSVIHVQLFTNKCMECVSVYCNETQTSKLSVEKKSEYGTIVFVYCIYLLFMNSSTSWILFCFLKLAVEWVSGERYIFITAWKESAICRVCETGINETLK